MTVLAHEGGRLAEVAAALPVATLQGDRVDAQLIDHALASVQPEVPILNAAPRPHIAPLPAQTWETFTRKWDVDVKATFLWIQAALAGRMSPGGSVVVTSSGAA